MTALLKDRADIYAEHQAALTEPIDPTRRYRGAEVALLIFGKSQKWWRGNRRALLAAGFPRPISNTYGAPWFGEDLIAWLKRDKSPEFEAGTHGRVVDLTPRLAQRAQLVAQR